jgi:hypothetical protein
VVSDDGDSSQGWVPRMKPPTGREAGHSRARGGGRGGGIEAFRFRKTEARRTK